MVNDTSKAKSDTIQLFQKIQRNPKEKTCQDKKLSLLPEDSAKLQAYAKNIVQGCPKGICHKNGSSARQQII